MNSIPFKRWTDKVYTQLISMLAGQPVNAYRQVVMQTPNTPSTKKKPNHELIVAFPRDASSVYKNQKEQKVKCSALVKLADEGTIKISFVPDAQTLRDKKKVITISYMIDDESNVIDAAQHVFNHFVNGHCQADGMVH